MKIVITGAGLAGLAAGVWLKDAGHNVEIFEASSRAGGRATTINGLGPDDLVDVGTQYFHSNYRLALSLIKRAGLENDLVKIRGKTRFFDERAKGGSFTTRHRLPYIRAGSFGANLLMTLKGSFRLLSNWNDPYAVLPPTSIDEIPVGAVVSDPFEWEFNARALITAGALVEPKADSISYLHLIRLMRIILMTDYLSLTGGIASLHHRLARDLNVHYQSPVAKLIVDKTGVSGVRLANGQAHLADHTIVATPPAAAARLLPESWQRERAFLTSIKQPPAVVVTIFLNQSLEKGVWSYVFRPSPQRIVSFCIDASQKNPAMVPSGNAVLQAWVCHPASDLLQNLEDNTILSKVIQELSSTITLNKASVIQANVHRVSAAIPQMEPGHNSRVTDFLKHTASRAGVSFCGDYFSGGYMESALMMSERIVQKLENK